MKLTTKVCLVPSLRVSGAMPLLDMYSLMVYIETALLFYLFYLSFFVSCWKQTGILH